MNGILHAHSGLRWVLLILLVTAIVNAFMKWKSGARFTGKDKLIGILTIAVTHTTAILGFILYFVNGKYKGFSEMSNKVARFYAVEHLLGMLLAVVFITIGYSKAKKATKDIAKFRKTLIWFLFALIFILISIPWPFIIAGAKYF